MLTESQKKFLMAVLVGLSAISLFSAISDSPSVPSRDTVDVPEATDLMQEMPASSATTYGTEEYIIINDMTSKGMTLRQYKRTFMNMSHRNYDVEQTYKDFDRDMAQYARYLKEDIMKLRAQRPARAKSMQSQADTLERAEQLYNIVSQYKQHEFAVKDTLEYIGDCLYALDRVSQQAKLPQG